MAAHFPIITRIKKKKKTASMDSEIIMDHERCIGGKNTIIYKP